MNPIYFSEFLPSIVLGSSTQAAFVPRRPPRSSHHGAFFCKACYPPISNQTNNGNTPNEFMDPARTLPKETRTANHAPYCLNAKLQIMRITPMPTSPTLLTLTINVTWREMHSPLVGPVSRAGIWYSKSGGWRCAVCEAGPRSARPKQGPYLCTNWKSLSIYLYVINNIYTDGC